MSAPPVAAVRAEAWTRRARERFPAVPRLAVDVALTVLAVAIGLIAALHGAPEHHWGWWVYALAVASAAPIPWRHRAPFACALVMAPFSIATSVLAHEAYPQVPLAVCVLVYAVANRGREWQRWFTLAALTVCTFLTTYSPFGAIFSYVPLAGSYVLGSFARELRHVAAAQAERAAALEREAEAQAARATVQERARIAREMHDILAHAVSLMVVQAEAGPVAVRADPDRAIAAFDAIAESGRDAMAQLRRMLGVLKEDGRTPERAPMPTLRGLPALVERVRQAGIAARLTTTGLDGPDAARVPPDVAAAAYRIVQEALTNTVKHSGARSAEVRLDRTEHALEIVVSDDGRGVPEPAAGTAATAAGPWSGGRGLVGIRERAAACGGSATAGPAGDAGGFVVTAYLPAHSERT